MLVEASHFFAARESRFLVGWVVIDFKRCHCSSSVFIFFHGFPFVYPSFHIWLLGCSVAVFSASFACFCSYTPHVYLTYLTAEDGLAAFRSFTMNIPSFRPSRALLFSLLVVSLVASKCVHLLQFIGSVPLLHFVVFLPTLFVWDGVVALVGRVLLHGGSGGYLPAVGLVLGSILSCVFLPDPYIHICIYAVLALC